LLGVGVIGALGLGWWVSQGAGDAAAVVDPDRLVVVERRDLLHAVTASGRVEPLARVAVMSRASGILKALLVEEGDRVQVGQVLAELDREQLEAQLAQDRADQAGAEARLAAAKARLLEARGRLQDPELDFARREAERNDQLFQSANVSERERDLTARALAQVEFRLQQVSNNLPVLEAAIREAEADLAAAQAALERSETALSEATIRCPMDGLVLVRDKEVGDGVSSILTAGGNATQVLTLGDLSEMFIDARVDEVDLGRIVVDMPAVITVDAHREVELVGQVARIAPAGSVDDNGIVTFEVRVTVDDPERLLKPDMTAEVRLVQERRDAVLTISHQALQRAEDGSWRVTKVAVGEDGYQVTEVPVTPGISDGLKTEIQSGLSEGDSVLLRPQRSRSSR
jgi:HlyD family secretion protein